MPRLRRGDHRLDEPLIQQQQQPGGPQELLVVGRQERQFRLVPGPPPGAAQSLQEGRDGVGRVDLDDAVEVADVDAELERARSTR